MRSKESQGAKIGIIDRLPLWVRKGVVKGISVAALSVITFSSAGCDETPVKNTTGDPTKATDDPSIMNTSSSTTTKTSASSETSSSTTTKTSASSETSSSTTSASPTGKNSETNNSNSTPKEQFIQRIIDNCTNIDYGKKGNYSAGSRGVSECIGAAAGNLFWDNEVANGHWKLDLANDQTYYTIPIDGIDEFRFNTAKANPPLRLIKI